MQRFSVHDGPGIRTTVFLKGCPLRCAWCHNPEGLDRTVRIWCAGSRCNRCGSCGAVCPEGAISRAGDGGPVIDHARCTRCGVCARHCVRNALALDGYDIEAAKLTERLTADRVFFEASGGGVSFSGGEPLAQALFVEEVARGLKARGIGTAMETSLYGDWSGLERLLHCIDFFQVDLKLADAEQHRRCTGVDNGPIFANFRRLAGALGGHERLLVRLPLIPDFTAGDDNLAALATLIRAVDPALPVELMDPNPLAEGKYQRLRREYPVADPGATTVAMRRRALDILTAVHPAVKIV